MAARSRADDDPRAQIALDAYVRSRVVLENTRGGRGYAWGVRAFSCPLCRETRGRGWLNVTYWTAGCWNSGCVAEPRLHGGAVEWVQRVEGLRSRGETWRFLFETYGGAGVVTPRLPQAPRAIEDWCTLPDGPLLADVPTGPWRRHVLAARTFTMTQWGLTPEDWVRWSLRASLQGYYAYRVVIPIVWRGRVVSFQARTWRGAPIKYLTATHGAPGEHTAEGRPVDCGRPAGALLFNLDAVHIGEEIVLVEGPGDVMGWARRRDESRPAVGLLGMTLTPYRLALLRQAAPGRIIVAMDQGRVEHARGAMICEDLQAWGLSAVSGRWVGGKDAGSGASLLVSRDDAYALREVLQWRLT